MHPAFDQIAPLHGITQAPDVVAATAITTAAAVVNGNHIIPEEVALTADTTGATPGGDPIPVTHHDHDHPNNTAVNHNPAEGIDPATEVGLDPQEDIIAIDPILRIINVPGVLQSLWTGSDVEQVKASIPSHDLE